MCQFPSVFMFITSVFLNYTYFICTYIGSMNADIIHQVILSSQVRVKFQWQFNLGVGKDHIR